MLNRNICNSVTLSLKYNTSNSVVCVVCLCPQCSLFGTPTQWHQHQYMVGKERRSKVRLNCGEQWFGGQNCNLLLSRVGLASMHSRVPQVDTLAHSNGQNANTKHIRI